jgi:hypothetical protein
VKYGVGCTKITLELFFLLFIFGCFSKGRLRIVVGFTTLTYGDDSESVAGHVSRGGPNAPPACFANATQKAKLGVIVTTLR